MFQTEVDVIQRKPRREKSVILEESMRLEERLDIEHAEQPTLLAQFETEEDVEFKKVLKSLV
jgi:hypothetical protein